METKPESVCLSRLISSTKTFIAQTGNYGYLDIDSISIRLPEEYEIESLLKTADLESKFGKFHSSITLGEGRNVFIVHRLQVYQGNYPKEEYPDFLNFRKNVATQYGAKIILKRTE